MNDPDPVRVRFAPSPTGYLHIGGARTALFNYLFARKYGGVFVLRIEDTDRERSTPEAVQAILDGLRYLGLDWDEGPAKDGAFGPYFQSERGAIYDGIVDELVVAGKAYRCFCSKEDLARRREERLAAKKNPHYDRLCREIDPAESRQREHGGEACVVRFRVEPGETEFQDEIRGRVRVRHEEVDDFIIRRADGSCVYNLAVVGDDHGMRITDVIRGEDHLTNTTKQVLLFRALGYPEPRYAHIPLILGPGKEKLSKRHGAVSVTEYEQRGYVPEAMVNFLVRMGWSYDDKEEIFSLEDLDEKFSLDGVSKSGAMYDLKKLEHLGQYWMRQRPDEEIYDLVRSRLVDAGYIEEGFDAKPDGHVRLAKMIALEKERQDSLGAIVERLRFYFRDVDDDDGGGGGMEPKAARALLKRDDTAELLAEFAGRLEPVFSSTPAETLAEAIEAAARGFAGEKELGLKHLAQPIRALLTGRTTTPPLFDLMALLGPERCVGRLRAAAAVIERARAVASQN